MLMLAVVYGSLQVIKYVFLTENMSWSVSQFPHSTTVFSVSKDIYNNLSDSIGL